MRTATVDTGGSPLGAIAKDGNYPDPSMAVMFIINVTETWARELACSQEDGDVIISKRGNRFTVTAPEKPEGIAQTAESKGIEF